ncbi:hypothetical protein DE146DRAFT_368945 [Phaeosphaeria sp. MPI-PUGE-AT-0046c]|nr:hypothetical protein DE146DRAFT_368945 [Phaeosphaeria sp. MPI-PUGE-AT-0046c]
MSQRGRPSSSQSLNESQRMPIEAAEALLWGKKTHEEHMFLFPRMRELEEQHRTYDRRIQAIEAVSETAEAAIARILHVERKVAAIESDEQVRPFDKWAESEITAFKSFVENNKTVRQKQVELENKVFGLEDVVDRNRDAHRDVQILLERIARLENERINDSKAIERLQDNVNCLTDEPHERIVENNPVPSETLRNAMPLDAVAPQAFYREDEMMDAADETEDEHMLPCYPLEQPVQHRVPNPPRESRYHPCMLHTLSITKRSRSPTVALPDSPKKGRDNMSARLRMMQRHSIYEPKQLRGDDRALASGSAQLQSELPPFDDSTVPATQIIDRGDAENRGLPREVAMHIPSHSLKKSLIVRLNTQRMKVEEATPVPRVTRSQARKIREIEKIQPTVPDQKPTIATIETQLVDEPATKRRKLTDARASKPLLKADNAKKAVAKSTSRATNLAKASPRKTAVPAMQEQLAGPSVKSPRKKPPHTAKAASSPRKKNSTRSRPAARASTAMDPVHLSDTISTSSRTLEVTSSPRKKNGVPPEAAAKASTTMNPVQPSNAKSSSSRFVSPKKTYSKSKVKQEGIFEVQANEYDFIDDNSR